MKSALLLALALPLLSSRAGQIEDVVHFPLDSATAYEVVTTPGEMTSIVFPGALTDAPGGSVSADNPLAQFMIQWNQGDNIVKVKPRLPTSRTNLNCEYNGQIYVIKLSTAERGNHAVYFDKEGGSGVGTQVAQTADPSAAAVPTSGYGPAPALTTTQLLALLDRTKEFEALRQFAPRYIRGTYRGFPNVINEYSDFTVTIAEVVRWDAADTIIFRLLLENKTDAPIFYLPERTRVRLANRLFAPSILDMDGILPAGKGSARTVWLAISGTSDDQRNNLAPNQRWIILLERKTPQPEGTAK